MTLVARSSLFLHSRRGLPSARTAGLELRSSKQKVSRGDYSATITFLPPSEMKTTPCLSLSGSVSKMSTGLDQSPQNLSL